MTTLVLKIFVHEGGILPSRGKQGDAGIDVFARIGQVMKVDQFDSVKIPLGFSYSFWIKSGGRDPFCGDVHEQVLGPVNDYFLEVENRSGVGTKSGMIPVAKIGDANYRGELHYCAAKVTVGSYEITPGQKIAQCLINPFIDPHRVEIIQVDTIEELGPSSRGDAGFGSSGK